MMFKNLQKEYVQQVWDKCFQRHSLKRLLEKNDIFNEFAEARVLGANYQTSKHKAAICVEFVTCDKKMTLQFVKTIASDFNPCSEFEFSLNNASVNSYLEWRKTNSDFLEITLLKIVNSLYEEQQEKQNENIEVELKVKYA